MLILVARTDKPEAEIGLYDGTAEVVYETWHAHRQLAETLHSKISELLAGQGKAIADLEGIVCYKGPGSFTGLRIGLSVTNALSYSLGIPVVAQNGDGWKHAGIARIVQGEDERIATPEYGAPVFTTQQKK